MPDEMLDHEDEVWLMIVDAGYSCGLSRFAIDLAIRKGWSPAAAARAFSAFAPRSGIPEATRKARADRWTRMKSILSKRELLELDDEVVETIVDDDDQDVASSVKNALKRAGNRTFVR